MQLDDFISIPDQGRVVDAIGDAEKMTSGEIRVHITPKCGDDVMKDAVKTFNRLKMYKTRHRNGVLIYVAFESRKFAILGDAGITSVETFLFDFDGDLYGQTITIDFVARLREERHFDSPEALVAQLHKDKALTMELFAKTD